MIINKEKFYPFVFGGINGIISGFLICFIWTFFPNHGIHVLIINFIFPFLVLVYTISKNKTKVFSHLVFKGIKTSISLMFFSAIVTESLFPEILIVDSLMNFFIELIGGTFWLSLFSLFISAVVWRLKKREKNQ